MSDWIAKVRTKWTAMKKSDPSTTWKQAMVACKGNQNGAVAPKSATKRPATTKKKVENTYHKNLMSESEGESSESSGEDSMQ